MIAKENLPGLQWPTLPRHHIDRNRRLRDIDAQFAQLTVDPGNAPQRVLNTHSSDQTAHLFADPWSATARTGFPSPICGEAHVMPTHNSLGLDDGYGVENARTATIEPNEQGTVGPMQMQSPWCALLQDIELMPQYQDFGFQTLSRLEAVAQYADEKEGNCNHATIMLRFAIDRESSGRSFRKRHFKQTRHFAKSISRARHSNRTGLKRFLPFLFERLLRRSRARSKQCGYCWKPKSLPSLGSCR